jgi:hypothetical protein
LKTTHLTGAPHAGIDATAIIADFFSDRLC